MVDQSNQAESAMDRNVQRPEVVDRKQAGYPRKQALNACQEQAGSITGRQKIKAGKSHVTKLSLELKSQSPEFICRCRLANELQVRLISGHKAR